MKKVKTIISSILLLAIVVMAAGIPAAASDTGDQPVVQPRMWCPSCASYAPLVCRGDATRWETGTHSYNWGKTCTFTDYTSISAYTCSGCYTVLGWNGSHWCWRVHGSCGKEYDSVCPCEIKDESFW